MAIVVKGEDAYFTCPENSTSKFFLSDVAVRLGYDKNDLKISTAYIDEAVVIYSSSENLLKTNGYNPIASYICKTEIYGSVMFLCGNELGDDLSEYITEANSILPPDSFDTLFLSSVIKDALQKYFRSKKEIKLFSTERLMKIANKEQLDAIMIVCYTKLVTAKPLYIKDLILVEDDKFILKFDPETACEEIGNIMSYFEEREEYEKCAKLRDLIIL